MKFLTVGSSVVALVGLLARGGRGLHLDREVSTSPPVPSPVRDPLLILLASSLLAEPWHMRNKTVKREVHDQKRLIYEYLPLIQIKANADGAEEGSLKL